MEITMDVPALSVAVLGLAVGAATLSHPLDLAFLFALVVLALYSVWTRKNALRRTAEGVRDQLNQELGELIEEAKRRASTPKG